jgi:hypothetical protein
MINRFFYSDKADLESHIILASLESRIEKLRERIGLGALDTRRPGLGALVTEEHVAVVRANGAGQALLVHLRPPESVLLFVVVVVAVAEGREVVGGHGGS